MENRYITTRNGFKMVVRTIISDNSLIEIYESYDRKKAHLLEEERYEELIELEKLKHFDFRECIAFWDRFDRELYLEVLKAKNR